ncbi:MAG: hypothetical protein HZC55_13825 [Verrucomicrobia bacterium]|nr:hypothetical protein [Verrucomicrobiota bacterium]
MADAVGHLTARSWAAVGLLLLSVALTPLAAQTAPAPLQAVRFSVFASRPLTDVAFVPRARAEPQAVKFLPNARSPRYEYRGGMPLRFVDPDTRAVVAEASIPADFRDVLLLFLPLEKASAAADGKLRYQVAVLDDSPARQPVGSLAILNLSGLALSGTVNQQSVTLKAGFNPPIPSAGAAQVRLTTMAKQRTYQSYEGKVSVGRQQRGLLILYPPFTPGSFEVQSRILLDQPAAAGRK